MLTFTAKLTRKLGQKIKCDFCSKNKTLTPYWLMDTDRRIACTAKECQDQMIKENRVGVSIGGTVE